MANVKATDLIDFTRASKGHALAKVSYGEELVTNGDFSDGSTGWVLRNNATISVVSEELEVTVTGTGGGFSDNSQGMTTTVGKIYKVKFDARTGTYSGNFALIINTTAVLYETLTSDMTTYEYVFVADSSNFDLEFARATSATGTVYFDNVSVKEVLFNQPDGTLQLFEHPNNTPRIEYDADGNLLGLLIEEARTNLIVQSNLSDWLTTGGASISTNYSGSPENAQNATALIASSSDCRAYKAKTLSGSGHTFSVYAKKGENRYLMLRLSASGGQYRRYFDLQGGVLASETGSGSASIQEVNGGWYRCSITTADTLTSSQNVLLASTNQDGTESGSVTSGVGVYLFGAQLEAGSFPTSYIKTQGSTVSRAADVASIDVDQFGYNQSEGTVVVKATFASASYPSNANLVSFTDSTNSDSTRLWVWSGTDSTIRWTITEGGLSQADITKSYVEKQVSSIGASYINNDFALTINGGSVSVDTSGSVMTDTSTLNIGSRTGSAERFTGHIKSITYTPKRLSNAKLQELTS